MITIGWREWVRIDGCPEPVKAKIDTGARTSALHAEVLDIDGHIVVALVRPHQSDDEAPVTVTFPLIEQREIRSSNGVLERRPVVQVGLTLGELHFEAEMSLTRRDDMGFRMLLGRTALRRRVLVDPAHSFRLGGDRNSPGSVRHP